MPDVPPTPVNTPIITGDLTGLRESAYSRPPTNGGAGSTGVPSGSRESVYSQRSGSRTNLVTPEWNDYFSGLADVAFGTVTADRIEVDELSAISADLGDITAGTITGVIITGSVLQTDVSPNARIELDSINGLRVYNSVNTLVAQLVQTLTGGSYFNAEIAKVTDFRTNDINGAGASGAPISIDAGIGATFGGSAEIIIDGSGILGEISLKIDGSERLEIKAAAVSTKNGAVFIGNLTGNLTGDVTGGTLFGTTLEIRQAASATHIDIRCNSTGFHRYIRSSSNGLARWDVIVADSSAESGGNVGSDFRLFAYDDAGSFIDAPISIDREAGGAITLGRPISSGFDIVTSGIMSCGVIVAAATSFGMYNGTFSFFDVGTAANRTATVSDGLISSIVP